MSLNVHMNTVSHTPLHSLKEKQNKTKLADQQNSLDIKRRKLHVFFDEAYFTTKRVRRSQVVGPISYTDFTSKNVKL